MNPWIYRCASAAVMVCFSVQAQAPTQTAITLQGTGPFYRLDLPIALYSHAALDDLRDVRVRNASGRAVPFAWLDDSSDASPAQQPDSTALSVPLFAMPPVASSSLVSPLPTASEALLAFKVRADGSLALVHQPAAQAGTVAKIPVAEWLIDASKASEDMLQLRLALAPGVQGVFAFTLQASDDMRVWREVAGDEQLVRLQHGGQTIERLSLELDHLQAHFLRLRWRDPASAPALSAAWIDSVKAPPAASPPIAIEWSPEVAAMACGTDYCDYRVPPHLPVQSLRIVLREANTLAPLRILAVATPNAVAAPAPPRRHHALYALRHGRAAAPRAAVPLGPQETLLADTVVYRLNQPGGEARSGSVPLDVGVYSTLRLRTTGPVSALGGSPPALSFGARPRSLAFLAQGQPPFVLGWNANAEAPVDIAGPLPLAQFMPGYQPGRALLLDPARVVLAVPVAPPPVAAASAMPAARAMPIQPVPLHKAWLWAALGGGLLLLGGMAWSLLRGLKHDPSTGP